MPPVNDNFANAVEITLNSTINTSNVGATKEIGESDHAGALGGCSIWYKFQIEKSESYFKNVANVTVSTEGSAIDTVLAIYIGNSVDNLTEIASDDDGGTGLTSLISFNAKEDNIYYIAIDGYDEQAQGDIVLGLSGEVTQYIDYDFSGDGDIYQPILINNIPAIPSSYYMNSSGSWIVSAGDGKLAVVYRYSPSGEAARIRYVLCGIDENSIIQEGELEEHIEEPYGGSFSFNIQSSYGNDSIIFPIKTNEHSFSFLNISGLSAIQHWYKIINPVFGYIAFDYSASSVFLSKSNIFILGIEGSYSFEGSYYKYRLFSVYTSGLGAEGYYSERFFPEGVGFSYPQYNVCTACGGDKAVYFTRNSSNQMTFVHVSDSMVLSDHFQCSDTDGKPLAISGCNDSYTFAAIYAAIDGTVKVVYGEITESGFTFSVPVTVAYSEEEVFAGVSWIDSKNAFTMCFAYTINSTRKFTILNCKVSLFEIIPDYENSKTYNIGVYVKPCCFYDKQIDKVIIGFYGDGSVYAPEYRRTYIIIANPAIEDTESFWILKILHKENEAGMLTKQQTLTVVPGKPGQPYIPSRPAIPSKTTITKYYTTQCKKVG